MYLLDQLAKTERLSANVAMWLMGEENLDPLGVFSGRRRTNFQDVSESLGFDGAFGKAMGFGMGVIADPLTWMSFGTLNGAKKAAQLATSMSVLRRG